MSTRDLSHVSTSDAGTWFLSYICEMGIILSYDTVRNNYVEGRLMKDYWGIPKGFLVFVKMEQDGETLTIQYGPNDTDTDIDEDEYDEESYTNENENEDENEDENENENSEYIEDDRSWWQKEGVKQKVVKVQINYI